MYMREWVKAGHTTLMTEAALCRAHTKGIPMLNTNRACNIICYITGEHIFVCPVLAAATSARGCTPHA